MPESCIRRVLMTTDTVGGVWTFTMELAREFGRRGVEVVMAALGGEPSAQQWAEAKAVPSLCVLPSNFKLEWMQEPWDDVTDSGKWLLRLERDYRPDVIHLNSFGHGSLPWRAPAVLTAHSCVPSWWEAVKQEAAPDEWDRYRTLVSKSLYGVGQVTAPSSAMAAALSRHYGIKDCRVIPNGRDPNLFRPLAKEPIILSAGRIWDEAKNIAAVAGVAGSLPWPVYIAGETRHPDGGAANLERCEVLGRLTTSDLAQWMARAAIFVLPARYEPFGLSVLEAGLSGCALVLGDIASLREVWGNAAIYVAPNDRDGLMWAVRSLIEGTELRSEMSLRSYQRALMFSPAATAERYLEAYSSAGKLTCAS
jgi:glycogen synthase